MVELKNSLITLQKVSEVISIWNDTAGSEYHTGVDIRCTYAYTCLGGTVLSVYTEGNSFAVIIQYDANHLVLYSHLTSVVLHSNQMVGAGVHIGAADKYVHVEYWVRSGTSKFVGRLGTQKYFKVDPLPLLQQCMFEVGG